MNFRNRMTKSLPIFPPRGIFVMLKANKKRERRIRIACQRGFQNCHVELSYFKCLLQIRALLVLSSLKSVLLNKKREDPRWWDSECKVSEVEGVDALRNNAIVVERRVNEPHTKELENSLIGRSGRCVGFGYYGKESNEKHKSRTKERQLQHIDATIVSHADLLLFHRELLRERKSG